MASASGARRDLIEPCERAPSSERNLVSGYQGYVSKVGPRNIYGSNYRIAKERAEAELMEPLPVTAAGVNNAWEQSLRGSSPLAPHLRGSSPLSQRGLSADRRITGEIPSFIDHVPNKNRSG